MKQFLILIQGDFKNISRDRMFLFILVSPFLMGLGFKLLIPFLEKILWEYLSFSLFPHYTFIMAFVLMLIPLIQGMMIGFMILEDRDQHLLSYFAVTPLSRLHYLGRRLVSSVFISLVFSVFIIYFLNLVEVKILQTLPVFLMAAMEAPLLALFISTYADNKVEAFALSKGMGILFFAPLVGYLLESKWSYLAGIFPTFWIGESFLAVYQGSGYYLFTLGAGYPVHLIFIIFLLKKFRNRVE